MLHDGQVNHHFENTVHHVSLTLLLLTKSVCGVAKPKPAKFGFRQSERMNESFIRVCPSPTEPTKSPHSRAAQPTCISWPPPRAWPWPYLFLHCLPTPQSHRALGDSAFHLKDVVPIGPRASLDPHGDLLLRRLTLASSRPRRLTIKA